jgi:uncharacterized protein (TIGR03435 family)
MRQSLHPHLAHFLAGFVCTVLAVPGVSQSNARGSEANPLSFEVVSIRLSNGARPQGINITSDGYEAIGFPIETSLLIAYTPAPFFKHIGEVKSMPSWTSIEKYDIQAKIAPTDVARWRDLNQNVMRTSPALQHMLQVLLAERCRLRIHYGETMTTGYALSADPKPLQLHEDVTLPVGDQGLELLDGARAVISTKGGDQIYTFYNISMPVFATFLSLTSKQTVEDRTGLHGRYKFSLRHITVTSSADDIGSQVDIAMPWDLRPLRLKTTKEKVNTKIWVVDNIEKPSPN